jgi:uncharacterized membrane protein
MPQPLHPAIVHFPIVLVVLLPIAAILALVAIRRGIRERSAWLPVVGIAAALAASAWLAVLTGKREEGVVERVVAESAIHDHEERAEFFSWLTVAGLVLVSLGLLEDRPGRVMRGVAVVAALGASVAGYRVGHSGGELVYEHGAASAYVDSDVRLSASSEGDEGHESR